MFCQKCGTVVADTATACLSCSAPVLVGGPGSAAAAGAMKSASRDALTAFKALAANPVGALAPAYASLGDAKAQRAGVTFGVVSLACFLLGGYMLLPEFMKEDLFEFLGFGGVMKCLLFGVVPFLCTTIGSLAVRKAFGGESGLGGDCFVAGAALLPVSLCILLSGLLGLGNYEVIAVLAVFAGCAGTLMLFAGYTRIAKLTDRAATIGVPVVMILTVWLAKVLATSVMGGPGGSDVPMMFPY